MRKRIAIIIGILAWLSGVYLIFTFMPAKDRFIPQLIFAWSGIVALGVAEFGKFFWK